MAPPVHLKAIAAVLNAVLLIAGLRNILSPGTPVPIIPGDDAFQSHFFPAPTVDGGGWFKPAKTEDASASEKMAWIFQLLGANFVMLASTKLVTVFCHAEGTFLRKKIFIALGAADLMVAALILSYKALDASVLGGVAAMHALEGAVFLYDALIRPRPVKGKKK